MPQREAATPKMRGVRFLHTQNRLGRPHARDRLIRDVAYARLVPPTSAPAQLWKSGRFAEIARI